MSERVGEREFSYAALTATGDRIHGAMFAASLEDARRALLWRGLLIVDLGPLRASWRGSNRISARSLALGLRMLANLAGAALPIVDVLEAFRELAPAEWQPVVRHVAQQVIDGELLSAALSGYDGAGIPSTVTGLVSAGEAGAGFVSGLEAAAHWAESRAANQAAIRSALAYPAIIACAGIASAGSMLFVVLPRFSHLLAGLDQALPPFAAALMRGAEWARLLAFPGLAIVALVSGVVATQLATKMGKRRLSEFALWLPGVGRLRLSILSAHSLETLASLLSNGVPVASALRIAGRASGDSVLEARLSTASDWVTEGQPLHTSLSRARAVSSTSLRLIGAGERSGQLSGMILHAALLERTRAEALTQRALKILEPTLVIGVAGSAAVVAAAMLQAIYSVRPTP